MINTATLIGNLGSAPEVRKGQSGIAVTNFNLATTDTWIKDGKKEVKTEWHRIVAFGKVGEICSQYLAKGTKVYIEGKIQTRQWDDKEGNKRYITEVVARQVKMLSPKKGDSEDVGQSHVNEEVPMEEDCPF